MPAKLRDGRSWPRRVWRLGRVSGNTAAVPKKLAQPPAPTARIVATYLRCRLSKGESSRRPGRAAQQHQRGQHHTHTTYVQATPPPESKSHNNDGVRRSPLRRGCLRVRSAVPSPRDAPSPRTLAIGNRRRRRHGTPTCSTGGHVTRGPRVNPPTPPGGCLKLSAGVGASKGAPHSQTGEQRSVKPRIRWPASASGTTLPPLPRGRGPSL